MTSEPSPCFAQNDRARHVSFQCFRRIFGKLTGAIGARIARKGQFFFLKSEKMFRLTKELNFVRRKFQLGFIFRIAHALYGQVEQRRPKYVAKTKPK